ncbi:MAG: response regulator transcription factor [Chloroflexota bacterium]|nr:response regulator transcription factor [Chloroflexota bacterium]
MKAIRILIVESDELGRHGLQSLLQQCTFPVEIVAALPTIEKSEAVLRNATVDVALISDELPRVTDMAHLVKQMRMVSAQVKVVVLSERLNVSYIQHLIHNGVRGFVLREEKLLDKLQSAITTVMNDEVYLSPRASTLPYTSSAESGSVRLNNQDVQVLRLMAQDVPVAEIAAHLNVTTRAIYRSRERLRHALGVRTNEQIVGAATAAGLLFEGKSPV